jgi:hypothetical protein
MEDSKLPHRWKSANVNFKFNIIQFQAQGLGASEKIKIKNKYYIILQGG